MSRAEDARTGRRYQHFACGNDARQAFINFWVEGGVIIVRAHRFTHNHLVIAMNLRRARELTDAELALIEQRTLARDSAAQIRLKLRSPISREALLNIRRQIRRDHRKTKAQLLFDRVNMWDGVTHHFWGHANSELPGCDTSQSLDRFRPSA
jgi:hypothetical protein